jgi:(1->4)-alpha-D-glucan 1-alpha-D-glucosylmutase
VNLALLDRLCAALGIATGYRDAWGRERSVPIETRRALIAAMGGAAGSEAEAAETLEQREAREWRRPLPPVAVLRRGAPPKLALTLPAAALGQRCAWTVLEEGGARHDGAFDPRAAAPLGERRIAGERFVRFELALPFDPPPGYHRLELAGAAPSTASLIVAPERCYAPEAVARGRVWGPAVCAWALRSRRNWGIGDYTDLRALVELAARSGAAFVGVTPLHALFPHDPEHASPYSPTSRRLLNVMLLDPEAVPDFAECEPARALVGSPDFQARLRMLRAAERVDYRAVAELKFPVLERLYAHFRDRHLARASPRAQAFRAFQAAGGEALRAGSLFCALQEHLFRENPAAWGWRAWPAPYRDPRSEAVAAFAREHAQRIEYHDYLQWNAELQLEAVGRRSLELGLGVGLYRDLAVGVDAAGAEAWTGRELYAQGATVGAPPDAFNLKGQNWGMPAPIPERMREEGYASFVALLRANMRHAGALRIDHVMGLARLYWIPEGEPPERGAYVSYPFEDLLGIVALESERNRCLVVGEDLGTLPEGLRERLAGAGVFSCRLLYFERDEGGAFRRPRDYPAQALAAASTHDLPTLRAFWLGRDLDTRAALGLFPSEAERQRQIAERAQDRARLLVALEAEGLLPAGVCVQPVSVPDMTPELALAVHRFLARAPSRLLAVQPEDVFGQTDQPNLPATTCEQHPNWRHRIALELEGWEADERFRALAAALAAERPHPAVRPAPECARRTPTIPGATYRLQLSRAFTFDRAAELVPYLHELGISHCYCSPYFRARRGSAHGYDIVDHNAFDPEIGDEAAFDRFVSALARHGMGQIVDMVPNHMGVMGADNAWWLDVLENGPASAYAGYFDIDWESPQPELRGKVLVPVLGERYGAVLERGELELRYDPQAGAFSVWYRHHRFPLDPAEYPHVLERARARLALALGTGHPRLAEFEALIAAFRRLPAREARAPEALAERARDKEVHKQRLAQLCERSPEAALCILEAVRELNGEPGRAASFDALHALLERQAYRLAYWRVASDEINYRRFLDANDLAALRMEDEQVFERTHGLLFRLLEEGKVDGVRVDYPDGLRDPAAYFRRLQRRFAGDEPEKTSEPRALYVVIEKVLADHERLPPDWPVHGTTGYRFANLVTGLFVDGGAQAHFERIYRAFVRERTDYDELLYESKRLVMRTALAAELDALANRLSRIARADRRTRDFTLASLREALATVVACFPVYRTYVAEAVGPEDRRSIERALGVARRRNRALEPELFDFLRAVLLVQPSGAGDARCRAERLEFVRRLQPFTAAVAAKGTEDTALYRYNRLVALNEVGGDPRRFGISLAAFHRASEDRARHWPHTLLATSTHDNKRAEDVRARLAALSELPHEWRARLQRWRRLNRARKRRTAAGLAPSANDEYLLYQTLLGTWPDGAPDEGALAVYRDRIERYMLKAAREAKVRTSWIHPDEEYEQALRGFVAGLLEAPERNAFLSDFAPFARRIARIGMWNSLAQLAIKIASPGVPDFYQGTELWDLSLVDPDNRRPVDYGARRAALSALAEELRAAPERAGELAHALACRPEDGRIKLYVTWCGLAARRAEPALFAHGDYVALETAGEHAERLCAFARVRAERSAILVVPRLVGCLVGEDGAPLGTIWGDTRVVVPAHLAGSYRNVYTAERHVVAGEAVLEARALLARFPVALLVRD